MSKAILINAIGILTILTIIIFKIPAIWATIIILGLFLLFAFNPFLPHVESIPKGFTEKQYKIGDLTINYVEGPKNGKPLLFIPGQMEFWQGYMLVMPHFAKRYHVFVVDVRGHGKSSKTPGQYSYNIIGQDLKAFLENIVKEPAIVSGLSSGAILALWLASNAPKQVSAVISEDPPLFASMYPRIKNEKYMHRLFNVAIEDLGKPKRDILGFFMKQGIPKDGYEQLFLIPTWIAKFIVGLYDLNKKIRPARQYDIPLAPFNGRVGFKFLNEYDVDFSKATIDGRLTEGFDPDEMLKKITCPVLLIHARWSRHKTWGLLGAMDDRDAERIGNAVRTAQIVRVNAIHDVHLAKPNLFTRTVDVYLKTVSA